MAKKAEEIVWPQTEPAHPGPNLVTFSDQSSTLGKFRIDPAVYLGATQ